jgi:hypothetical protein
LARQASQLRYENIQLTMERDMQRYHVRLGQRRTTVSVDKIVSQYPSLHLGTTPGTLAAHTAVRAWLQSRIDLNNDPGRIRVSQWLLAEALDAIVGPNLREAYGCWLDIMLSATKSDHAA